MKNPSVAKFPEHCKHTRQGVPGELPDLLRVFEHQVRMVTLECLLASSEDELLEAFDVDLYEVDTCDSFALEE